MYRLSNEHSLWKFLAQRAFGFNETPTPLPSQLLQTHLCPVRRKPALRNPHSANTASGSFS
jgi:hypothetical protein